VGRVGYRFKQFWQGVTAPPLTAVAQADIAARLTPAEQALFQRYSRSDQWHTYRVMKTLQASGQYQPPLLKAALLHDVGKSCVDLSAWERSWIVLVEIVWPRKAAAWGEYEPAGWRRPFVVKAQHPAWGAEMAAAAGSSPLVVELIRRHQDKGAKIAVTVADHLLHWLQWADDQN